MSQLIQKDKDLSVHQLFETLQEEFILCELRNKIYSLENHKIYWSNLAEKKKEKILDIAKRNSLLSIFDDKRIKRDYEKRVIPEIGFPSFKYKNDSLLSEKAKKWNQKKWDKINYYMISSEVKVIEEGVLLVGRIKAVNFEKQIAQVEFNSGELRDLGLAVITRIL